MLNCFSGVFTLKNSHKIEEDMLFVIGESGDDVPTLCFMGKQKETMLKWGKPGRVVAVAGAVRTKVVNKSKMTYIEVAYSRFLDKSEAEAVSPVKAAPAKAPAAAKATKAPKVAKAAKVVTAAPAVNDELPWD